MRVLLLMISLSSTLMSCEGGFNTDANDKRSADNIKTQGLFSDWSALDDKYETRLKFKDLN